MGIEKSFDSIDYDFLRNFIKISTPLCYKW